MAAMEEAFAHETGAEQGGEMQLGVAGPHMLAELETQGIAASDLKKLQEAGIHTVEGLMHASLKRLVAIKGLTEVKIKKLKDAGAWRGAARGHSARAAL